MPSLAHSINSNDRLGIMLLLAVVIHAIFILGIVFDHITPQQHSNDKSLDIIVVNHIQPKKNKNADFLAQQSQQGGGELNEKKRLTSKPSKPTLKPSPQKRTKSLSAELSKPKPAQKVLSQKKAHHKKIVAKPIKKIKNKPKKVNVDQLLASTQSEIDLLTAEIDLKRQNQTRKPRRKFINSSTQEYKYAAYLTAWRKKVENIGNLNYPDEAKKKRIFGNILMTVVLQPNGKVSQIHIKKSSGHKILDDAAIRIVKLAAPFAPFPKNIRKETDELVITRTWQFVSDNKLFAH